MGFGRERVNASAKLPEVHLLHEEAPGRDLGAGMAVALRRRVLAEVSVAREAVLNRILVPALQAKIQE